ncbi:hypothetical protein F2Q69_00035338 [Brassica cretica]|uniref:Uncharacterized protein n=1 Tax=Brassica cretica TaxID=69181 RepID=A0A8S9SG30_BRACR|nr:hypothetical protein F2Q69_00035338 [Brassica cretica]
MPVRKNEELIASWRPGEAGNWSPMATERKTRASRLWRPRGGRVPVTRGDREGDACRSPVATAREGTPVARGDCEGGDVGRLWRPRGWSSRSPVATAGMACSVALWRSGLTSVLGLGQDLGLITALGGAMTTSAYVSRIVFDLVPSRFKVRDMFSAYVTCLVGIEHLFEDNF